MKKITSYIVLCTFVLFAACTPQDHLTILHTNDTHSQIEPKADSNGGYARRMGLIKQEREADKNLLLLDAGDFCQGTPYFNFYHGRVEIDAMNRMGYDVATLGNHEFYAGHPEAKQFYKDAGIHLLIDEVAVIDSSIVIVGRDDRTNMHRKSVKRLVPDRNKYTIVLDHQPYDLNLSEEAGVDFQLSGHTHRGQVWPISWITDHVYECSWGSHQRGQTQFYVSSGIGIWGGRFRIGTQSEYVVATLRSNNI